MNKSRKERHVVFGPESEQIASLRRARTAEQHSNQEATAPTLQETNVRSLMSLGCTSLTALSGRMGQCQHRHLGTVPSTALRLGSPHLRGCRLSFGFQKARVRSRCVPNQSFASFVLHTISLSLFLRKCISIGREILDVHSM